MVEQGKSSDDRKKADDEAFFADPTKIHIIGMTSPPRPGLVDCIQTLRDSHYLYPEKRRALLSMQSFVWFDIQWIIVSIPADERDLLERCATASGLEIVDGIPAVLNSGGIHFFPISNERMFTFENRSGHPAYKISRSTYGASAPFLLLTFQDGIY